MARIIAEGQTIYGKIRVSIEGNQMVKKITCDDDDLIEKEIRDGIANADGWIANAYHPEPDTMLQAYAFLLGLFDEKDITITGDIGEIPNDEEGVIY